MNLDLPGPQAVRKLQPGKLVIASHNPGKVREIRALLGPYGVEPVSAAELVADGTISQADMDAVSQFGGGGDKGSGVDR